MVDPKSSDLQTDAGLRIALEAGAEPVDPRQLLGEFKTALWFPRYRAGQSGPWRLRAMATPGARGYWGDYYRLAGMVVLTGPSADGRACWMSTTPSEIESQEIGLDAARGHTAVLGLGMGWLAANVALRDEVRRLTVVEHDPRIIALITEQGVFEQLPREARDKIEIVEADANAWRPAAPVDVLLADIWATTYGEERVRDVRRMQDNVGAAALHFWGQEVHIWQAACRRASPPALDWPLLRAIVAEDLRLPLILPDWPDYPQKIAAGAQWWTTS
ncbi:MAG TPA: hypothetical protein VGC36_14570 [Rhizomicrobium sp.]